MPRPSRSPNRLFFVPLLTFFAAFQAHAAFTVNPSVIATWRNYVGPNSIGQAEGDRITFEAFVAPTGLGVTLTATSSTGFVVGPAPCAPQAINPRLCFTGTNYNSSLRDPWTLAFTDGAATQTFIGPSLYGAESRLPLAASVTLTGAGTQPVLSWQVPNGFSPDFTRIIIRDKNRLTVAGVPDIILSTDLVAGQTSYSVPAIFPSSSLSLQPGGQYVVSIGLTETRNHQPFTGNDAQILNRATTYIDFSPLPPSGPAQVYLPTFANGAFNFSLLGVDTQSIYYLDPPSVNGYLYESASGSPRFASVLLPNVGDGLFALEYMDGGLTQAVTVRAGQSYAFGSGGAATFKVTGIEESAGLSPTDPLAFITGVTFASAGDFNGKMTALPVPEPGTGWMLLLGLSVALFEAGRKRTS